MPDQFWDLSWKELDWIVRNRQEQIEREWDIARTLGAWTIAPHTKKKVKPRDLLKLPSETSPKITTREEFEKVVATIQEYRNGKSKTTS